MGSLSSPNLIKDVYTKLVFRKSDGLFYRDDGTDDVELFNPTVLDEDNMASNSATSLSTQQSIKAYVDTQLTAEDLDISADSGSNIAIDLDSEVLAISGGEGIDTSITGNAVTIAGEEASTSNKGVASFSSDNFAVSSGAVTIKDAGVILGTETTGNYVATAVAGEGIDVSGATGNVTISSEDATSGNKGIASFSTDNFSVSSGAVTIKDAGVILGTETTGNYVATAVAGEGIDVSGATGNVTISSEDATDSNKGVASFSTDNFSVSSGVVTIKDDGVILTTETTGDYVGTITGGTGVDSTAATSGEGTTHTLSLDLNELSTETTIADADFIAMVDATDDGSGKITFENLEDAIFASVSGDIAITEAGVSAIQDNSVDSDAYVDSSIDLAHMSVNSVDSDQYVDGSIDLIHMSANSVDSDQYVDGSIDNAHLADDAVDSDEIAAGAIDLAHMSVDSIDSDQYVDGSIDLAHMSVNSIDSDQYVDGSIDNAHLADDAVDSDEIAAGAIDLAHMSVNSIDSDQYVNGSIDNEHLADDAVDSDEIAAGAIDLAHMSVNSVDSDQYVDLSIDNAHVATGLDAVKIADGSVTNAEFQYIGGLTSAAATLASPTFTGNPIAPTQSAADNSTKIATTAYADTAAANLVDSAPAALNTLNELAAALGDDASFSTTVTNSIATKLPLAGGAMTGAITTNSTFDGVDIATRDGVLTSTTTTANAALPKAGGAMTGAITTNSTFDGVDIATRDGVLSSTTTTANAALPKAGGTMAGNIAMGGNDISGGGTITGTFVGGITGNVTGNASGTAATVTTAAQSAITSLGTLTTLTVDNVIINGTTIGHTGDTDLMTVASGVLTVAGEVDATSLDISGDADVDGTLEADAYTVDGTALDEYIADTVGAMVGSNTESGITVAYEDGDNTLDFTVATLNQDTSGTAAIATTVTITDNESTDEDNAIIFTAGGDVDGGNLGLESDGTCTYNPSTGKITATGFVGTLTGNVTGDVTGNVTGNTSGTAATVTTAAQSNITSLGTLTTLTVDNVIINGSTIGHTGDTDLITVASGIATVAGEVSMTTLDIGGTNVTSTAAEINLLDALDRGSILYGDSSGATAVLGQGSADQVLTSDGTDIAWASATAATKGFAVAMAVAL